jgi:hypothetical protein
MMKLLVDFSMDSDGINLKVHTLLQLCSLNSIRMVQETMLPMSELSLMKLDLFNQKLPLAIIQATIFLLQILLPPLLQELVLLELQILLQAVQQHILATVSTMMLKSSELKCMRSTQQCQVLFS